MDRKFVISALCYAMLGMLLGIYMAATQDHGQFVTHAHIMLVGFVVSFIYALCHKLWLDGPNRRLAQIQFYLHQGQGGSILCLIFNQRITLPDNHHPSPLFSTCFAGLAPHICSG